MSLAAGTFAQATHAGSFVWGDSTGTFQHPTADTANNQFIARASGGVKFYSSAAGSTDSGVSLASGSGSWSSLSDRHAKRDIHRVSGRRVLRKLERLRVDSWSYKAQQPSIHHIGPIASAFRATYLSTSTAHAKRRSSDTADHGGAFITAPVERQDSGRSSQTRYPHHKKLRRSSGCVTCAGRR
jgi:hypothetical protein